MSYSGSNSENDFVAIKRKSRQRKHRHAYTVYSNIEDSEEEIKFQAKKQQKTQKKQKNKQTKKKKKEKKTLKNLKVV